MTDKQINHIKSIIENKKIKTFGVEIPLTDEQVKEFEKMIKPQYKNPYERVKNGEKYYITIKNATGEFEVVTYTEDNDTLDDKYYNSNNYYNNKGFAEQIIMELNLQRKLRKFTYDNGWSEELWENGNIEKYFIQLNYEEGRFEITCTWNTKRNDTHFISMEIAQRAIKEIIIPFMEENPTFKW